MGAHRVCAVLSHEPPTAAHRQHAQLHDSTHNQRKNQTGTRVAVRLIVLVLVGFTLLGGFIFFK